MTPTPPGQPPSRIDVRRAADRFATRAEGVDSRHSFSFGPHYDPANTHHGLLLVHHHDVVAAGTGYDTHPHRDSEILTWVLEGSLVHEDSSGHRGVIHPGLAQRMSAGRGIRHSERNDVWTDSWTDSSTEGDRRPAPVHFVQMRVAPEEPGGEPGYDQRDVTDALAAGGLVPVASGMRRHRDEAAVRVGNRHAAMYVARLRAGGSVTVPEAPFVHLYVARGSVSLEGAGELATGDAVRLTATGGQRVSAVEPAEVLVWEMHAAVGR